jgi:two-component system, LytTR family, response regulator
MKVLIIEDEITAARRLKNLISKINPDIEVVDQLDSIESVLNWLEKNELPDLIFMDIHLADGSSFEIFNHVKIDKPVIFTTAYDVYAIQAFQVNAVDYILKPIKEDKLKAALEKYVKFYKETKIDYQKVVQSLQQPSDEKRFLIRLGHSIRLVNLKDVAYFYTKDKITFLITKNGKRYPIDYSLEKLDEIANPKKFFRINRQFIINLDAIKGMLAYSKSRVKVDLIPPCDLETIVSTERSPVFKRWLLGDNT